MHCFRVIIGASTDMNFVLSWRVGGRSQDFILPSKSIYFLSHCNMLFLIPTPTQVARVKCYFFTFYLYRRFSWNSFKRFPPKKKFILQSYFDYSYERNKFEREASPGNGGYSETAINVIVSNTLLRPQTRNQNWFGAINLFRRDR